MAPARRLSAGAVVFRDVPGGRRYLLLRNAKGHWDFPKGGVEAGESLEGAARREAREEAGLKDLQLLSGFAMLLQWRYREGGRAVFKRARYLLARTKARRVSLSKEHTRSRWVSAEEGRNLLAFPNARKLLKTADRWASRHAGRAAFPAR